MKTEYVYYIPALDEFYISDYECIAKTGYKNYSTGESKMFDVILLGVL